MIGLQMVLEVFNTNPNQIANKLGVSRQTVYDWLKGKRKISEKRLTQLAKLSEFKFINKEIFQKEINEVDKHDIQIAYINYLAEKETADIGTEVVQFTKDLFKTERNFFLKLKESKKQMNMVEGFLNDNEYIDELNDEYGVVYSNILGDINHLFVEKQYEKIGAISLFVEQLRSIDRSQNHELMNDVKKILQKHNLFRDENTDELLGGD
ncbi:helix-turn-helix domain-containing protein [bacterium LRH843]|nr:helix-turn-helix domain-containing protein [bacterium LRH843]